MRLRPEGHDRRRAGDNPAQRAGQLGGLLSRVRRPAVRDSSRVAGERLAPRTGADRLPNHAGAYGLLTRSDRTFTHIARSTFYGEGGTPLQNEDLIEIENAGRRCGVCRSGRGWRRFELVRPAGPEPIVLCGSCRARYGDDPPVGRKSAPPSEPVPAAPELPAPPQQRRGERVTDPPPDRLRAALGKLPGSFSTAMAARAAGLNSEKALARLEDLERRGEVRRVGKRWSTESPPSDVAAAMDRLQARTSNLRIVRDRARVG